MRKSVLIPVALFMTVLLLFLTFSCTTAAPSPSPAPTAAPSPTGTSTPKPAPTSSPSPTAAPKPTAAPVKPMEFTLVMWNGQAEGMQTAGWALAKEIEKRTNGVVKVKNLGGVEVIPAFEQPEAVRSGVVDITWSPVSYSAGMVPLGTALTISRLTSAERRKRGIEDIFVDAFKKQGMFYLMHLDSSSYPENFRVFLNVLIDKPEDLKGLKIRTSPSYKPMLDYFGAVSVSIPGGDTYPAMERKMIQGFVFPASDPVFNYGLPEVTKYFVSPGFGAEQILWLMNLNSWNKIPADMQKTIIDTAKEIEIKYEQQMRDTHTIWVDKFLKAGMKEIKLSPEAGARLVKGYDDSLWADIIKKEPVLGSKVREMMEKS